MEAEYKSISYRSDDMHDFRMFDYVSYLNFIVQTW